MKQVLTTPLGLSGFSTLTEQQLRDGFGYSLDLYLDTDNEEHVKFISTLKAIHEENIKNELSNNNASSSRDLNIVSVSNSDVDFLPEGSNFVRVKLKSNYVPKVFDSKGQEIEMSNYLPFLSTVRAKVTLSPYTDKRKVAGTSLYLQSVQIAKLGESNSTKKDGNITKDFGSLDDGDFVGLGVNVDDISL